MQKLLEIDSTRSLSELNRVNSSLSNRVILDPTLLCPMI